MIVNKADLATIFLGTLWRMWSTDASTT